MDAGFPFELSFNLLLDTSGWRSKVNHIPLVTKLKEIEDQGNWPETMPQRNVVAFIIIRAMWHVLSVIESEKIDPASVLLRVTNPAIDETLSAINAVRAREDLSPTYYYVIKGAPETSKLLLIG